MKIRGYVTPNTSLEVGMVVKVETHFNCFWDLPFEIPDLRTTFSLFETIAKEQ